MIRIECPLFGLRPETEFVYGGDASVTRPAQEETDPEPWLVVERNTLTHDVLRVELAREAKL